MLTTLVSVSPIYASFDADEPIVTRALRELQGSGRRLGSSARLPLEKIPVRATMADVKRAMPTSASRLHLRSILMNSMAFVMGVLPLVLATCAGAEMRQAMGLAVFAKMVGATAFEIFLTPVCCVLVRGLAGNRPLKLHGDVPHVDPRLAIGGWGA